MLTAGSPVWCVARLCVYPARPLALIAGYVLRSAFAVCAFSAWFWFLVLVLRLRLCLCLMFKLPLPLPFYIHHPQSQSQSRARHQTTTVKHNPTPTPRSWSSWSCVCSLGCFSRLAVHCKLQCATKNLQKQTPHSTTREVYCKLWELGKKLPLPHTSLERGVGYMARNARINQAGRSETQACGLPCHNLRPKCHTECDLGLSPAAPCHAH